MNANHLIRLHNLLHDAQEMVTKAQAQNTLEIIHNCEWYLSGIKAALDALEITDDELI